MTPRQVAGFLLLCLWSSSNWLTADLLPPTLPALAGQGLHLVLIGLVTLCLCLARGQQPLGSVRHLVQVAGWGTGLLAVPFLLLNAAQGSVPSTTGVLVFALTPVVAAGVAGALTNDGNSLRLTAPTLVGVAGILLLLPMQLPQTVRGAIGLGFVVAAMASTALSLVLLHRVTRTIPLGWVVALVAGVSGAVLEGSAALLDPPGGWNLSSAAHELVRCLLLDLPTVLLFLWLIKDIAPHRIAARYLVSPLFTVIEGVIFVRQGFGMRMAAGLLLLTVGSFCLFRANDSEESTGLSLSPRNFNS